MPDSVILERPKSDLLDSRVQLFRDVGFELRLNHTPGENYPNLNALKGQEVMLKSEAGIKMLPQTGDNGGGDEVDDVPLHENLVFVLDIQNGFVRVALEGVAYLIDTKDFLASFVDERTEFTGDVVEMGDDQIVLTDGEIEYTISSFDYNIARCSEERYRNRASFILNQLETLNPWTFCYQFQKDIEETIIRNNRLFSEPNNYKLLTDRLQFCVRKLLTPALTNNPINMDAITDLDEELGLTDNEDRITIVNGVKTILRNIVDSIVRIQPTKYHDMVIEHLQEEFDPEVTREAFYNIVNDQTDDLLESPLRLDSAMTKSPAELSLSEMIAVSTERIDLNGIFDEVENSEFGPGFNPGREALKKLCERVIQLMNEYKPYLLSKYDANNLEGFFGDKQRVFVVYLDILLNRLIVPVNKGIAKSIRAMVEKKGIPATPERPFVRKWVTPYGIQGAGKGTLLENLSDVAIYFKELLEAAELKLESSMTVSLTQMTENVEDMKSGTGGPFIPTKGEDPTRFEETRPIGIAAADIFQKRIYLGGWSAIYNMVFNRFMIDGEGASTFIGDVYPFDDFQKATVANLIEEIENEFEASGMAAKIERESFLVMRSDSESVQTIDADREAGADAARIINKSILPFLKKLWQWPHSESGQLDEAQKEANIEYFERVIDDLITFIRLDDGEMMFEELKPVLANLSDSVKTDIAILLREAVLCGTGGIKSRLAQGINRPDDKISIFAEKGMASGFSSMEGAIRSGTRIIENNASMDRAVLQYVEGLYPIIDNGKEYQMLVKAMETRNEVNRVLKAKFATITPSAKQIQKIATNVIKLVDRTEEDVATEIQKVLEQEAA